jgi:hypothetical protein
MATTDESDSPPAYELRYVAFIDVLGFAALVQRSITDPTLLKNLVGALRTISSYQPFWRSPDLDDQIRESLKNQVGEHWANVYNQLAKGHWGIAFSDTIVSSHSPTAEGLWNLFSSLWLMVRRLLDLGILVRGGVALGPVYYADTIIFGPSLIEAYRLESQTAVYPRIILSDRVLESIADDNELSEYKRMNAAWCRSMVRRDFDGLDHLDVLATTGPSYMHTIGDQQGPTLERCLEIIEGQLNAEIAKRDPGIRAKLNWYRNYVLTKMTSVNSLRPPNVGG